MNRAERVLRRLEFYERLYRDSDLFRDVRDKIAASKYKDPGEFIADVESAIRQPAQDPVSEAFADHAIHAFRKACRKHHMFTQASWVKDVMHIRAQITKLTLAAPTQIAKHTEPLLIQHFLRDPTSLARELALFADAQKRVKSAEERREMLKIVAEMEPDRGRAILEDPRVDIDLTNLKLPTFVRLKNYVKSALARQGIEYPAESRI